VSTMSRIDVFLDSSVLFAGVASSAGAARALLLLGEAEQMTITVSEQVITQTECALARKLPTALRYYRQALRRNSLLMGKTQMGKSNLMDIPARRAITDQDGALVVLDPQGDTVRALRGMVPPDRIGEAYYLDLAEEKTHSGEKPAGLLVDDTVWAIRSTAEKRSLEAIGRAGGSRRLGARDTPTLTIGTLAIDKHASPCAVQLPRGFDLLSRSANALGDSISTS